MATEKDPKKDINDIWKELVKPFPKEAMGKKPQPYKRDSLKGKCTECGGYHGLPALHLDFVSHAAITNRLNTVAGVENWDLTPLARDEQGNPVLDKEGNLWATLTILGASKIEVGDGSSMKDRVANALRRCGMRFGMALELWSKEELENEVQPDTEKNQADKTTPESKIHPALADEMREMFKKKGLVRGGDIVTFSKKHIGKNLPSTNEEAQLLIDEAKKLEDYVPQDAERDGASTTYS